MPAFLLRRLAEMTVTLLLVSLLGFLLVRLMPGDPAEAYLRAAHRSVSHEAADSLRAELGVDKPLWLQYANWLEAAAHGDFGTSFYSRKPIKEEIGSYLGATLLLSGSSLLLAVAVSLVLGTLSFVYRGRLPDLFAQLVSYAGTGIPVFLSGYLLMYALSLKLQWLPMLGMGSIAHVVLPAITLSLASIGTMTRLLRSSMLEHAEKPFILYARARGLKPPTIIGRHLLKAALLPFVTTAGLSLGAMLSGSILVENVFAWPGIGRYFVTAVVNRDYPVIQCCMLLFTAIYVFVSLLTDAAYAFINPRIRLRGGAE